MPEYSRVFKKTLKEYNIPDTSRNLDDVKLSDEVDSEVFNVDPTNVNVGFKSSNTERDVKELKNILNQIEQMADKMKSISEEIASLDRSFLDIGKTSKTVANINQKMKDLIGELEGYVISLPAQKDKDTENPTPTPDQSPNQGTY